MNATLPCTEAPPDMLHKDCNPDGRETGPHDAPVSSGARSATHVEAGGRSRAAVDRTSGSGGRPNADGGAGFSAGRQHRPRGAGGR